MAKKNASYTTGYNMTMSIIKTTLVNGLDEFGNVASFITFLTRVIGLPVGVDTRDFVEGLIDAANQEWSKLKEAELQDLVSDQEETIRFFAEQIAAKKSA